MTYLTSGVNIDAGNALVEAIKPLARSTVRPGADTNLGGFGGVFDLGATGFQDPILVTATDGVGTKLKLAFATGIHNTVGIDLVAMCANDLIVQGAEPLFFLDYFATGHLDESVATEVISGIAEGCRQAGCALIGGDTAEMPDMYNTGEYDLAGFVVGAVERRNVIDGGKISEGDLVLGMASNGVHSNGFSLVRNIIKNIDATYDTTVEFPPYQTLGDTLLRPTRIYVQSCLAAIAEGGVNGLAHITGGGLIENIPRVIPNELCVRLETSAWPTLPIFEWIAESGNVPIEDMRRTFNLGIGMVLIVSPESVNKIIKVVQRHGESIYEIGRVEARGDRPEVIFEN